jgi:Glycosyl transferases group 1
VITVFLYRSSIEKIEHCALVHVGFQQLARAKEIRFDTIKMPQHLSEFVGGDDLVICGLLIDDALSREVKFTIDLRDRSDRINARLLQWSDVYFKRSIDISSQSNPSTALHQKIQFYGINCAARDSLTHLDSLRLLKRLVNFNVTQPISRTKTFLSLPSLRLFEQSASVKLEPTILFQSRVWTASEVQLTDSEAINENRVLLIRNLRAHFGPKFIGGLLPNALALSRYPDVISDLVYRRRSYANMAKTNLIGIYSEGLSNSTAFKFMEYLAGSQCIVAEKIANQLPHGCAEGIHYLPFTNSDECIKACERLLNDHAQANKMRIANEQLYKQEVSPVARARRLVRLLS